jgi:hypothetical protein
MALIHPVKPVFPRCQQADRTVAASGQTVCRRMIFVNNRVRNSRKLTLIYARNLQSTSV